MSAMDLNNQLGQAFGSGINAGVDVLVNRLRERADKRQEAQGLAAEIWDDFSRQLGELNHKVVELSAELELKTNQLATALEVIDENGRKLMNAHIKLDEYAKQSDAHKEFADTLKKRLERTENSLTRQSANQYALQKLRDVLVDELFLVANSDNALLDPKKRLEFLQEKFTEFTKGGSPSPKLSTPGR